MLGRYLTVAAVALAVAVGAVALAVGFGAHVPVIQASRLAGVAGPGETGMQIINLSSTSQAAIRADFYRMNGPHAGSLELPPTPPLAAVNIWLPGTSLPTGSYAATMRADQPISAIIRTDWPTSGGAAIYSDVPPGNDVALPLVVRRYNGQSSLVMIQNTHQTDMTVAQVSIFEVNNTVPAFTGPFSIPPGTSIMLDMEDLDFLALGERFLGSMQVQAPAPVAVQSFVDIMSSQRGVYGFEGVPVNRASTRLFAPLFRAKQYPRGGDPTSGRLDTGISVVNPGTSAVDVTLTYFGSNDRAASIACRGQTFTSPTVTIAARSSHVFYQGDPAAQNLPEDCFGSAIINATGPVLAIVNDAQNEGLTSAAYNAAASGSTRVALPLYRREHAGGLSTGIQAMNLGAVAADVTIRFSRQHADGTSTPVACGGACTARIEPGSNFTWWPPNLAELEPNTFGSAVIDSSEPIAVIVNDVVITGERDMATYNGLGISE